MDALEMAWLQATEMGGGRCALYYRNPRLWICAAALHQGVAVLVDASVRLQTFTTTLVQAPLASVNARIERLIAWKGQQQKSRNWQYRRCTPCAFMVTTVAAVAVTYSQALYAFTPHRMARAIGGQGSANSQRGSTDKQIPSENP